MIFKCGKFLARVHSPVCRIFSVLQMTFSCNVYGPVAFITGGIFSCLLRTKVAIDFDIVNNDNIMRSWYMLT